MKKAKLLLLCIALSTLLLSFVGCKKKENGKVTVTTKTVAEITTNSAKCGGKVTLTGDAEIGVCGVCWSESPSPTTNDFFTTDIVGAGEYISTMNSLKPNTKYFVRAYATLSSIVMYGEEMAFTTLSSGGGNGGGTGGDGTLSVTTNDITEITASSAVCGGNVTINGEVNVTAKGVCWSTSHSPTLENAHTTDGQGDGAFTSNITGLSASTVYYVRAYATNNSGVTTYGNEKDFTTQVGGGGGGAQAELPTVITSEVTEITDNAARGGGEVTSDGGAPVTARGICWSTTPEPTIGNSTAFAGMGTGSFVAQMTDLEIGTTYYAKAYATNSVGTAYGNEVSFTTKGLPPQGAINALFSVSETKKVYFSQGNLQFQASTNTWRFAEHQWDFVGGYYEAYEYGSGYIGNVSGSSNDDRSPTYSGWIDLFAWGTSGRPHGAVSYQPWSYGPDNDYYAYGSPDNNLYDLSGEADWGYNAISNGGQIENLWRTLTIEEWKYLLEIRPGYRFVKGQISNLGTGLIIFPDNWNSTIYSLQNVNVIGQYTSGEQNKISSSDWNNYFQANGAVFLPCCTYFYGSLSGLNWIAGLITEYWSASQYNNEENTGASYILFCGGNGMTTEYEPTFMVIGNCPHGSSVNNRGVCRFVRLVHDY